MPEQQFAEFKKITEEMYDLHVRKNNDYSSDNISILGEKGVFVRVMDKCMRLRSLVWENKNAQVNDESIDDSIKDLAVYCIIWMILRRGTWGK